MFPVGFQELVIIAVIGLILFSPRELPKILRSVARFWGQLRATADEFKDAIMHADGVDDLHDLVNQGKKGLKQAEGDARRELMKARAQMRKAQQKLAKTNRASTQLAKDEAAAEMKPGEEDEGFKSDAKAKPPGGSVHKAVPAKAPTQAAQPARAAQPAEATPPAEAARQAAATRRAEAAKLAEAAKPAATTGQRPEAPPLRRPVAPKPPAVAAAPKTGADKPGVEEGAA